MKRKTKPVDQNRPCYQHIVNEDSKTVDILLHDDIGFWGTQSKDFTELLNRNRDKDLDININSGGGDVADGFAMYSAIKSHPGNVKIKVSGAAYSIAAFITLAAKKENRFMAENSMMMFHRPYMFAGGNPDDFETHAKRLKMIENQIISTLDGNTTISKDDFIDDFNKDWWMNPDGVVDAGIIPEGNIEDKVTISNFYDLDKYGYKNIPDNARELVDVNFTDSSKGLFTLVKNKFYNKPDEGDEMKPEEIQKINDRLTAVEASNKEKDTIIKDQAETIKNLESRASSTEKERRTDKFKNMVDKHIGTGKIKPVDREIHITNLENRYSAENTEAVDAYEKYMNSLEVVVNLSNEHVANKNNAVDKSDKSEKALEEKIKELMDANKDLSYGDASREARNFLANAA